MTVQRGLLICLEGCDRSGKSTQCQRLVEFLQQQGQKATLQRFPERTTVIGQMINAYLSNQSDLEDHVIHLLFSANRWELKNQIESALSSGTHVVLDRYCYSGAAFSMAKGLDRKWCEAPDLGLLKPDLTLFLDLPVEEMSRRLGFGEERYENKPFQMKVYEAFHQIKEDDWIIVDANVSIDEMSQTIQGIVRDKVARQQLSSSSVQ